jgi:hypothetical protein
MPGTQGSEPSMTLGMPHTFPDVVHKQSLPCIPGTVRSRVPSVRSLTRPFLSLEQVEIAVPFLASVLPAF